MSKRIDYTLSEEELAVVLHAIQYSEHLEVRGRATALHLLHLGHPPSVVGQMVNVTRQTAYNWYKKFRAAGIAGLRDKAGRGRKRKATSAYIELLEELLDNSPAEYGYKFSVWTAEPLLAYLHQATGIKLSERTFTDLMKALGYVYRRPQHSLKYLQKADEVAAAQRHLRELKGGPGNQTKTVRQSMSSSLWTKQPAPSMHP